MRFAGFASGVSGLPSSVTRATGEGGVDLGCVEFERLDTSAVVEPVAARLARALGVLAPHEASAKTVPASSPNRMSGSIGIGEEDHVVGAGVEVAAHDRDAGGFGRARALPRHRAPDSRGAVIPGRSYAV